MKPWGLFAGIVLFTLGAWPAPAQQPSQRDLEAQLKSLAAELTRYRDKLESTEDEKSGVEEALRRNEQEISRLLNEIAGIRQALQANRARISDLEEKQAMLQGAKREQQHHIERQVRAAYELGHREYLKVLLNQEDPHEITRMLTWYDYFNRARSEQIRAYNRTLADLEQVAADLAAETDTLNRNRERLAGQRAALALTQEEKRATLQALVAEIQAAGTEISKLERDRARLEQLLERLHLSIANLPTPGASLPFPSMRGKLLLPVRGTISQKFGNRRSKGKLKWQGLFIDAPEGAPVYAVHYGRVVFSEWLRGFGLLMIISHGEGYMSLYGHNQALYRETGDWVTAQDVIATVGDTGGQNRTGLYFEIRVAGKPSDPQQWCVARKQGAA